MTETTLQESKVKDINLVPNNMLFVIPSWSSATRYYTMGEYQNKQVIKIHSDPLIFFSCADMTFSKNGELFHCLFGLGYYNTKFEIDNKGIIQDNKILTGLILSDFVYDHIASSPEITLKDTPNIVFTENVYRIPFSTNLFESEEKKTFIQGIVMRNLFTPFKDTILEMVDKIKKDPLFDFQEVGHLLLFATKSKFDEILYSKKLRSESYKKTTAGIQNVVRGTDEYLIENIPNNILEKINDRMENFYDIFKRIEFDVIYPFTLIEKAAEILDKALPDEKISTITGATGKTWIFNSAMNRINEIAMWSSDVAIDEEFEKMKIREKNNIPELQQKVTQVMKESQDTSSTTATPSSAQLSSDIQSGEKIVLNVEPSLKEEEFKLDRMSKRDVETKPLPSLPETEDIEEILKYIYTVVKMDYPMRHMAHVFEICWERLRKNDKGAHYIFKLSNMVRRYEKEQPGVGLSPWEHEKLTLETKEWYETVLNARLEAERLEKERLEKIRLEEERVENERLEKIRLEKERVENERLEKERLKQELFEKKRLEKEKAEQERLEKERLEKEHLSREKERLALEQAEKDRLEREKMEREAGFTFKIEKAQKELKEILDRQLRLKTEMKANKGQLKNKKKELKKFQKAKAKEEKQG